MSSNSEYIVDLPAGKYSFCDPCYVLSDTDYDALINKQLPCGGCILKNKEGMAVSFPTEIGDGTFDCVDGKGRDVISLDVDSGMLAVVSVSLQKKKDSESVDKFDFDGPAQFILDGESMEIIDDSGKKLLSVHTGFEDMEEEYDDEEETYQYGMR